jgi:zinc transport system substrate-binding protein
VSPRQLLAIILACPLAVAAHPLGVVVSVLPLGTILERVGGDRVSVTTMVRPGQSPHTYEPTPKQIAALGEADLYIRVGLPFEEAWMDRFRAANPRMQIADAREGLDLLPMIAHDHGPSGESGAQGDLHDPTASGSGEPEYAGARDDDGDSAMDPHIWTSPPLVKQMSLRIRDVLTELDPEHRGIFARNQAALATELDQLDGEIRARLQGLSSRRFLVFHPAWGYFAATYGLEQVPIERDGKTPGTRALAALIEQARREDISVIFVQPQFDRRYAAQVADAIAGRVVAMDPLAPDYFGNLRQVADVLAGALGP